MILGKWVYADDSIGLGRAGSMYETLWRSLDVLDRDVYNIVRDVAIPFRSEAAEIWNSVNSIR